MLYSCYPHILVYLIVICEGSKNTGTKKINKERKGKKTKEKKRKRERKRKRLLFINVNRGHPGLFMATFKHKNENKNRFIFMVVCIQYFDSFLFCWFATIGVDLIDNGILLCSCKLLNMNM